MSLNTKDICLVAQARLSPRGTDAGLFLPLVRAKLPQAINMLAFSLSNSPRRRLLQNTFNFPIAGTPPTADLSTEGLEAAEPLLLPFDPYTGNYIAFPSVQIGGIDCKPVADRHTLGKLRNDGRIYYTIQDQVMFFGGALPLPDTSVVIVGNFVPAIQQTLTGAEVTGETVNLPTELQDEIVTVLTNLFAALAPVDDSQTPAPQQQQAA